MYVRACGKASYGKGAAAQTGILQPAKNVKLLQLHKAHPKTCLFFM